MENKENQMVDYVEYEISTVMKKHSLTRYDAINYLIELQEKSFYINSKNIAEYYSINEDKFFESEKEVFDAIDNLYLTKRFLKSLKKIISGEKEDGK